MGRLKFRLPNASSREVFRALARASLVGPLVAFWSAPMLLLGIVDPDSWLFPTFVILVPVATFVAFPLAKVWLRVGRTSLVSALSAGGLYGTLWSPVAAIMAFGPSPGEPIGSTGAYLLCLLQGGLPLGLGGAAVFWLSLEDRHRRSADLGRRARRKEWKRTLAMTVAVTWGVILVVGLVLMMFLDTLARAVDLS